MSKNYPGATAVYVGIGFTIAALLGKESVVDAVSDSWDGS